MLSEWTKFVTKYHKDRHAKDKNYTFRQAMSDASPIYKKGNKGKTRSVKKGGAEDAPAMATEDATEDAAVNPPAGQGPMEVDAAPAPAPDASVNPPPPVNGGSKSKKSRKSRKSRKSKKSKKSRKQ